MIIIPIMTIHETMTDSGFFKKVQIYIDRETPIPVIIELILYRNGKIELK